MASLKCHYVIFLIILRKCINFIFSILFHESVELSIFYLHFCTSAELLLFFHTFPWKYGTVAIFPYFSIQVYSCHYFSNVGPRRATCCMIGSRAAPRVLLRPRARAALGASLKHIKHVKTKNTHKSISNMYATQSTLQTIKNNTTHTEIATTR